MSDADEEPECCSEPAFLVAWRALEVVAKAEVMEPLVRKGDAVVEDRP